jgi:hypothetical protein
MPIGITTDILAVERRLLHRLEIAILRQRGIEIAEAREALRRFYISVGMW